LAEEAVLSSVLSQVSKKILEKLEKGKKLSTEDILLLYLDMTHKEIRDLREEIRETRNELRDEIKRVEARLWSEIKDTNRRIDDLNKTMSQRIDQLHANLLGKIEEVNKRINKIYETRQGGTA
jgi:uncharacterized coiled-coil DUF342 family protein